MSKIENKIDFFKPEDFSMVGVASRELAALNANTKLEREGKPAYSYGTSDRFIISGNESVADYKALVICIEPVNKCTHPKEKVLRYDQYCLQGLKTGPKENVFIGTGYQCECGKTVTPSGFEE